MLIVKLKYLFKSDWVLSAIKIAFIVGTILFVINHGTSVLENTMTPGRWVSVVLSYMVPYTVYIIGKASNMKKED
ncbi:MAG: nitrate/nitrite transporter NrtS [Bacteroidia bacterium]